MADFHYIHIMFIMKKEIILVLIGFALGFFFARITVKENDRERLVAGKKTTGSVYVDFKVGKQLKEFKTDISDLPLVFWKTDTVVKENSVYLKQEIDTVKILEDFLLKRDYSFNVFNDDKGKLDVKQTIQYNRLQSFDYTFTPIHIERTRTKERLFVPFVSASYNTLNYVGAGGGVFIKDLGLEYNYLYNNLNKSNGHLFSLKYKF